MKMYYIWLTIKPFIIKLPLFVLLYFLFSYIEFFLFEKEHSNAERLFFLSLFIFKRFFFFLAIKLYDYLLNKLYNSSFYAILRRNYLKVKRKFIVNKIKPVHYASWAIKVKLIPRNNKDSYSLELYKESNKLIEDLNLIAKELRKEENVDNLELINKFSLKLSELNDIKEKYKEHNKSI